MKHTFKNTLKYIGPSLMALVVSATTLRASDNSSNSESDPMRRAYAAIDLLYHKKGGNFQGLNPRYSDQSYDTAKWKYGSLEEDKLFEAAQDDLMEAYAAGNPFAAYALAKLYAELENKGSIPYLDGCNFNSFSEATKTKITSLLLEDIKAKNEKGRRAGIDRNVDVLAKLNGISVKSIEGIHKIKDIDERSSIRHYAFLATQLDHADTDKAFSALQSVQQFPETWEPLAEAHLSRKNYSETLQWFEKALRSPGGNSHKILQALGRIIEDQETPLEVRIKAARIRSEHETSYFPWFMDYYKLLKQGNVFGNELFRVSGTLMRLAKDSPEYLYELASLYLEEGIKGDDYSLVIDMLQRSGSWGLSTLETLEAFLSPERAYDSGLFFVTHKSIKGLKALQAKTNNDVFTVLASLVEKRNKGDEPKNYRVYVPYDELPKISESYAPALSLKILNIQREVSHLYAIIDEPRGFVYMAEIEKHKKEVESLNKEITSLKQKIDSIKDRQQEMVSKLSAKDQYDIAQEYNYIHQGEKLLDFFGGLYVQNSPFHEGFLSTMTLSAHQGYLPAVEELLTFYQGQISNEGNSSSNSLSASSSTSGTSEKVTFYQTLKEIITNKNLSVLEQAAQLKALTEKQSS